MARRGSSVDATGGMTVIVETSTAERSTSLVLNPGTDERFVSLACGMAAAARAPHELQRRLRDAYPGAVVRRRELSGERLDTWYVYRDGSWRAA
jgi:hypothetical protein